LKDQFRSIADPINNIGVVNVTNLEALFYQNLKVIIFVSFILCRLFYVINVDVVRLFIDSSFLF